MKHVEVTAQRGESVWVLECAAAGVVSQCEDLSEADAEMREAIAHQLCLEVGGFVIDLVQM